MSSEFQKIGLNQIMVGDRHRKELGDIAALAKSIAALGMLQPVVVRRIALENGCHKYRLVAGSRRLAAARELKWATVPAHVVDNLDDAAAALRAERDENTCRKDFTPSEAVAIGRALEELEKPKAAARKKASQAKPGQKVGTSKGKQGASKLDAPSGTAKGRSDEKAARAVGMGKDTYRKAKAVVEAAEDNPDLAPVVEDMDRSGKVDPAYQTVVQALRQWQPATAAGPEPGAAPKTPSVDPGDLGRAWVRATAAERRAFCKLYRRDIEAHMPKEAD
jgi:ParB family chromosome partitioning protein